MKKIISLLLIATLLFGISALATDVALIDEILPEETVAPTEAYVDYYSAPVPSKVYYHLDFEDYASIEEFLAEAVTSGSPTANATAIRTFAAENSTAEKKATLISSNLTNSNSFVKNDFGGTSISMKSSSLYIVPENTWNSVTNSDELFVVSYDLEDTYLSYKASDDDPVATASDTSGNYWFKEPAEGQEVTVNSSLQTLTSWRGRKTDGYVNLFMHKSCKSVAGTQKYFPTNTTHTVAFAFRADLAPSDPELIVLRTGSFDGILGFEDQKINTTKTSYEQGMRNCNTIGAFYLTGSSKHGIEVGDIKMYTIKKTAGSFNVSMDTTTNIAPSVDSVKVKFSQPVAKTNITDSIFSMTEDGVTFTGFKVGRVKTYVDEITGQIGTEVEIKFTHGLKSSSSYEIVVNSAIKNEIALLSLGSYNTVTFNTAAAPANTVSILGKAGLEGGNAIANLTVGQQAKFTAKVESATDVSYIIIGIYNGLGELVSYTYAKVNQGEEISLASKIDAAGMAVKAFSAGNLYDLEPFSNPESSKIN